jgi:tetratricopeptide (TPR) repeat protein
LNDPSDTTRLQMIVSLGEAGDVAAAVSLARAIADKVIAAEGWRVICRINANMQRLDAAREAIDLALHNAPASRQIRLERALLMEKQGLAGESLAELEHLAQEAEASPELLAHLARALHFAERTDEAETRMATGLRRWPTDAPLHILLAQLRWRRGAGEHATALLEQAIEKFPGELKLRLVAADLLRNAGFAHKALALLEEGLRRAPGSVAFATSVGVLLDSLDRPSDALPYLRAAAQRAPDSAQPRRNLIPTLLRLGAIDEALQLCEELSASAPDDQQLIAYRATALRQQGDAHYQRLHDYSRLVRIYRLAPPASFAGIGEFNAAFAGELLALHRSAQRPLDQSLRGGSQTERNLPAGNPVVAAFFAMVDAPIRDYIDHLRDGDHEHPTDRRKSAQYRIAGSWSVQLQPGGFHVNHVHPQGWLSSAYYVELPEVEGTAPARAGWLKFGEPAFPMSACPPDHFVEPAPGMLVLFPSYLWHGTVPFETGGRRLTAAFDVVPA